MQVIRIIDVLTTICTTYNTTIAVACTTIRTKEVKKKTGEQKLIVKS